MDCTHLLNEAVCSKCSLVAGLFTFREGKTSLPCLEAARPSVRRPPADHGYGSDTAPPIRIRLEGSSENAKIRKKVRHGAETVHTYSGCPAVRSDTDATRPSSLSAGRTRSSR